MNILRFSGCLQIYVCILLFILFMSSFFLSCCISFVTPLMNYNVSLMTIFRCFSILHSRFVFCYYYIFLLVSTFSSLFFYLSLSHFLYHLPSHSALFSLPIHITFPHKRHYTAVPFPLAATNTLYVDSTFPLHTFSN